MNLEETGKLIAKLRKEAGYTQASLAEALLVTDKAVSKWERGLCVPDTTLLPKLSRLLDADMEFLISANSEYHNHEWEGLLVLDNPGASIDTSIYDKPMLDYLISYFMLVGIKHIDIRCSMDEEKYIRSRNLEQYGIAVSFGIRSDNPKMIIYGKYLLFGMSLTRHLQNAMGVDHSQRMTVDGMELPVIFSPSVEENVAYLKQKPEPKAFGRGTIAIPLETEDNITDAGDFVRIYQQHHRLKIADLHEIALRRGIIQK